jgi:hypothetical protein
MLPELARSLRTLGAPRDAAGDAAHTAIFLPLLEARAKAANASSDAILGALRGTALSARIEANAVDAAVHAIEDPRRARALTAQTSELIAPLRAELQQLDALSTTARDDDAAWDAWIGQLRRVFTAADVACNTLSRLLATKGDVIARTRWFERNAK